MKHYLVVANRTLGGPAVRAAIMERLVEHPCHFHVLVPTTRPQGMLRQAVDAVEGVLPGDPESVEHARDRLVAELEWIKGMGAEASGETCSSHPVEAVQQVLRQRRIDGIILSTLPAGASRWLALDLPSRLERETDLPLTTVVEPDQEAE